MHVDRISSKTIGHAERRTHRAWFEDGLPELGCGALCLGGALFFAATVYEPRLWLILPVVGLAGALLYNRIFFGLKERITDRRTGYLRYPQPTNLYRLRFILIVAVVNATLDRLADTFPAFRPWLDASLFVLPGVALLGVGAQTGLRRFLGLAVVALVVAAAVLLSEFPKWPAYLVLLASVGTALLVSGALALRSYLRQHPV